jgi:single-strand DNA-binding protein
MRLATHTKKKSAEADTEDNFRTTWHTIRIWGRERVERIISQFIKGSHVLVEGTLEYRTYVNKEGQRRDVTQINAYSIMNLDR